jgi:biopolymer transport protein ExbD
MRIDTTSEIGEAELNLAPMIDVVFLLLIFFVCTMSFRVIEGRLDTQLPKDVGPNAGEVVELFEPIDLWVLETPLAVTQVRVGHGATYPVDRLPEVLASARAMNPDAAVRIHAAEQVTHGQVVSVVDACLASHLAAIRFAGPSRR